MYSQQNSKNEFPSVETLEKEFCTLSISTQKEQLLVIGYMKTHIEGVDPAEVTLEQCYAVCKKLSEFPAIYFPGRKEGLADVLCKKWLKSLWEKSKERCIELCKKMVEECLPHRLMNVPGSIDPVIYKELCDIVMRKNSENFAFITHPSLLGSENYTEFCKPALEANPENLKFINPDYLSKEFLLLREKGYTHFCEEAFKKNPDNLAFIKPSS